MQRARRGRHRLIAIAALAAVGVAACGGDDGPAGETNNPATTAVGSGPPTTTPTTAAIPSTASTATTALTNPAEDWLPIEPAAAGMDAAALAQLAADAEAAGSTCTVVVRDGRLVDEHQWGLDADAPREAWSVTKSVTSTLVGIAQDQGLLALDDPVSTYVPEWLGTHSEDVTIRDILSNVSGRAWDMTTDYAELGFAADKTAFAIALGQDAAPGEVWAYNNSAIQVLDAVLEAATGESPAAFAERVLFEPLGMAHSHLSVDAAGNTMLYAGLQTTCRDLARFGVLALHGGLWDGEQIVSAAFMHEATRVSATELNAAYGWLWWLNHRGAIGSPSIATRGPGDGSVADGQFVADLPEDVFWALGLFDQLVAVLPAEGVVAVRMGDAPPRDAPFGAPELSRGVAAAVVGPD